MRLPTSICFILLMFVAGYGQLVGETLQEINRLKTEISRNELVVEQKLADLKQNNPLFDEQDIFESDQEYAARMSRAVAVIQGIKKQYLTDYRYKLGLLRSRGFETRALAVQLDKNAYDANRETWPVTVLHGEYAREKTELVLTIAPEQARLLYQNRDNLQKTGTLSIGPDDKVGLARIRLYEPVSGFEFVHERQPLTVLPTAATGIFFTAAGDLLLTGGRENGIRRYRVESGEEENLLEFDYYASAAAVSPDGGLIAVGSDDKMVHVYDPNSGLELNRFPCNASVSAVAFGPDGYSLAAGEYSSGSSPVYLFDLSSSLETARLSAERSVYTISYSPDGQYMATGSEDGTVTVYDVEELNRKIEFTVPGGIYTVAFSPRGDLLAVGGEDDSVHVFSVARREKEFAVNAGGLVFALSFSPDGSYLAAGSNDHHVHVYSMESGQEFTSYSCELPVSAVAFSPAGNYLAAAAEDQVFLFRTLFQTDGSTRKPHTIARPPVLSASAKFSEPSGDGHLDALETGTIKLTVKNTGAGAATQLRANLYPVQIPGLNYNNTVLGAVLPGKSVTVEIPVEAYIGVANGNHRLRVFFEEANGFPPPAVEVAISTRSYLKPELFIVDVGIEDADENGKIESGELIRLMVRVGNKSKGTARDVFARVYAADGVFITDTHPMKISLGDIAANSFRDVPVEFFINEQTPDEIPLFLDLTEQTGLAQETKIRVPVSKGSPSRRANRTVAGAGSPGQILPGIGTDPAIDIEIGIPYHKTVKADAIAVIIGNKNYRHPDIPEVSFAQRDAAVMKEYLVKALGFKEGNILYETDATQGTLFSLFGTEKKDGKLQHYIRPGKSEVFIYYSGHGAPHPETKSAYLVPVDSDPANIDLNGYALDLFYKKLNKLDATRIQVVIDACFSGSSANGMLLKNISPVFIEVEAESQLNDKITLFTSASGEQVSSWYPDKKHSLYTYYFLKGLKGAADRNSDRAVTAGELQEYLQHEVSYMARKLNSREQTPGLQTADPQQVLIRY